MALLRNLTLAAVLAVAAVGAASAQDAQQTPASAAAFTRAVAKAPPSAEQYARWNTHICPSVAGIPPEDAQRLIDHIALRAHQVGVRTDSSGCSPNLVIVFAPDSDAIAHQIATTRRDLLGYYNEDDVISGGRADLDAFANTPRPIRWWHVARRTDNDGNPLGDTQARVGHETHDAVAAASGDLRASGGNGIAGAETVHSDGSRMHRSTRQDLSFALILVDTTRIAGVSPAAVADYVTMATLVQLDPNADLSSYPTVLNLFSASAQHPDQMTNWDTAYLAGLYRSRANAATIGQQRADITNRIVRQTRN